MQKFVDTIETNPSKWNCHTSTVPISFCMQSATKMSNPVVNSIAFDYTKLNFLINQISKTKENDFCVNYAIIESENVTFLMQT